MEQQRLSLAGELPAVCPNSTEGSAAQRRNQRNRYITYRVRVDHATARWLNALARANSAHRDVRVRGFAALLEQAAFCLADCAGRRTGSWEADVARTMLIACGYVSSATERDLERLHAADRRDSQRAATPRSMPHAY